MEFLLSINVLKIVLSILAVIAGIFVITTKNPIISVFNLIVLYILVAFYLIYIGITYLGISYIIIYIGAIAILFLFVIMMIDIEVVEKRNNNYLPLLFLLLGGFLLTLKQILFNIGLVKLKNLSLKDERFLVDQEHVQLFNLELDNFAKLKEETKNITNFPIFPSYDTNNELYTEYNTRGENHYLLINPDWNSATSKITQISAVGDVLYTIYHSYIYIVSVILLLGMVGAIILTTDSKQEINSINIFSENKKNNTIIPILFVKDIYLITNSIILMFYKKIIYKYIEYITKIVNIINLKFIRVNEKKNYYLFKKGKEKIRKKSINISSFLGLINNEGIHSEGIIDNLIYFIIANIIIAILLLFINSYFSISIKYLDKGGGFECGFTSFVQTRERFNVIFYRVSLLFLIFDLEIILAFPYTAIYQKNQNISKNNVLAFLYILIIGFVYELKEGALNIVKKAHTSDIDK